MTSMYVAAGGGGDVIGALMLHAARGIVSRPVIATYAWDRLLVDPLPGLRAATDFGSIGEKPPGCETEAD